MNKHRFKWLGLVVLSLATLLVTGCGGGCGASAPPVAKVAGTVSFPTSASLSMGALKLVPKSVAAVPTYGVPTVTLRNLAGAVVATATVTGTAPGPYAYTFTNVPMGVDYVVKASIPDTNYLLKALIDKNAVILTTTKDLNAVSTTAVVLTEEKLNAAPGTLGDSANAVVTTSAIATVNPLEIESQINSAISAGVTADNYKLINLTNVLTATVFSNVNTASFIAGTLTDSTITTTQYTSTGVASTDAVVSSAVPAVLSAVADAIITQPVVVTPPATTTNATKDILTSGLYYLDDSWNQLTNTSIYYVGKLSLATDGLHVADTNQSYFDPVSKSWTTAQPVGFENTNSEDYVLTPSGWKFGIDNWSDYTAVSNSDGSITLTNAQSGASAKYTVASVDVSGLGVTTSDSYWMQLVTNPVAFPKGSLRYDITVTDLTDSYYLWQQNYVDPQILSSITLSDIPAYFLQTGYNLYIDSIDANQTFEYSERFNGTGITISRHDYATNTFTSVGTATYAVNTVMGQQFLEIIIPSTLRTQYELGGNPIVAILPTLGVMSGVHTAPGTSVEGSGRGYNETAINHIKASINTALAKPVVAKKISKSILGF